MMATDLRAGEWNIWNPRVFQDGNSSDRHEHEYGVMKDKRETRQVTGQMTDGGEGIPHMFVATIHPLREDLVQRLKAKARRTGRTTS